MTHATRRQFLTSTLTAGAGLALGGRPASAIEPIQRQGKAHLRLSIAAYSYRKYLDLKKPTMTLDDFVELAAMMNLDAVEPTEYYFADTSPRYLAQLKGKCTRLGLDVSGTAVKNDFCNPNKIKADLAHVRQWVERTSLLGGKTIRIFAGYTPKGDTEEAARKRCVEAIQEACDHAGKYGVYLALENHGGITARIDQILAIVQAVQHPWFGVNLDSGNFRDTDDPYADLARLAPYAVVAQVKTEIRRKGQKKNEEADLKRLLDILRAVNYRGYVALEYEAGEEPKTAIPRHVATLQKLLA